MILTIFLRIAGTFISCSDLPKHMVVIQDGYELVYEGYFGGVVALRRRQFEKINGVSNKFCGSGCLRRKERKLGQETDRSS